MSVSLPALARRSRFSCAGSTTTFLVFWSLVARMHSVSLKRFHAYFSSARKFFTRDLQNESLQEKIDVPCALPTCALGQRIGPSSSHSPSFIRQPFSQRVRQGFEFRRVLTLHVLHNSMCQQAIQRFPSHLCLCLPVELAACSQGSSAQVSFRCIVVEDLQLAHPSKPWPRSPQHAVVSACRFHQRPPSCSFIRQIHLGAVTNVRSRNCADQFFVASTTAGSGVLLLSRRRLARGVHSVSGRAFTVSDSGRAGDDLVPLEDVPPVRSVSPASAIVGLSSQLRWSTTSDQTLSIPWQPLHTF